MLCPNCKSRATGKVGLGQFYCWDCCIEWSEHEGGVRLFAVDEDGELQAIEGEASSEKA